ncbi:MAG: polyprenyl synthetase family protein [Prevotellaceae bacterium]|nr:polyprenyl synthetase family protein [Prevotellaceae bacterium]
MNDYLSIIRQPIEAELGVFDALFADSLSHSDGQLSLALDYIRQRAGKRMRPILILLMSKVYGEVTESVYRAALGLELLHTASLVHDDIVDESAERRGQASVNAVYDNKVAVLVGDYILSTALLNVSQTGSHDIVRYLASLGQTLANGEILQLTSNGSADISEEAYYDVIKMKTAALFEACCAMGAMAVGAAKEKIDDARRFGQQLGIIFQIRDDIFDYYDSEEIGKPTGNDMAEGKLTLPVIHALLDTRDEAMMALAQRVKARSATPEDIARLVDFTKRNGGIEYAQSIMERLHGEATRYLERTVPDNALREALQAYLDYVIKRTK